MFGATAVSKKIQNNTTFLSSVLSLVNNYAILNSTAKKFIYFFKGEVAQHYIDWDGMGIENPLDKMETLTKSYISNRSKKTSMEGKIHE